MFEFSFQNNVSVRDIRDKGKGKNQFLAKNQKKPKNQKNQKSKKTKKMKKDKYGRVWHDKTCKYLCINIYMSCHVTHVHICLFSFFWFFCFFGFFGFLVFFGFLLKIDFFPFLCPLCPSLRHYFGMKIQTTSDIYLFVINYYKIGWRFIKHYSSVWGYTLNLFGRFISIFPQNQYIIFLKSF